MNGEVETPDTLDPFGSSPELEPGGLYSHVFEAEGGRFWPFRPRPEIPLPAPLGNGRVRLFDVHSHFRFVDYRAKSAQPFELLVSDIPDPEQRTVLAFLLCIRGGIQLLSGGAQRVRISQDEMGMFHPLEGAGKFGLFGEHQQIFHIGFSLGLFRSLAECANLPEPLRCLADGRAVKPLACGAIADPRFMLLAREIIACPYDGLPARLHREARALDLLALLIDLLDERKSVRRQRRTRQSVERLREVHAQLLANLRDPPSLVDLARAAGMSPSTLKRGFREVFGTSVTQAVREARLQLARRLIEQGDMPLKAIAREVGFCDPSSLHHAFTTRFGTPPGKMRLKPRIVTRRHKR